MIYVIATIELKPGERANFLANFKDLVPHVLNEAGCIEYVPTTDRPTGIAAQIPPRDDVMTVVEKWESLPHLEAHLVAPHMVAFRERVKALVVGTSLQVVEPA